MICRIQESNARSVPENPARNIFWRVWYWASNRGYQREVQDGTNRHRLQFGEEHCLPPSTEGASREIPAVTFHSSYGSFNSWKRPDGARVGQTLQPYGWTGCCSSN